MIYFSKFVWKSYMRWKNLNLRNKLVIVLQCFVVVAAVQLQLIKGPIQYQFSHLYFHPGYQWSSFA